MYAGERVAIDAALERACDTIVAEAPPALADAIRYALEAKGKRLRPILCVAAYRATRSGAEHEAIYDVAAAIELIHTYSLVHDDLPCMDDDDLRRGRPTTHRVFGTAPAAVAGAALIPHACACLEVAGRALGLDDSERATLVRELARAAGGGGMVGGQLLDLEAEGSTLDIGKLQDIHRRKTGALFEASLRIGGVAARASTEAVDALGECGRMLGLAFQITDDLLDETGQSAVLGKTAGRDREREKATFPRLLGVTVAQERAEDAAAQAIDALERAGIDDTALRALVRFAVERDR
jgi:geranylgeranyl pyrophosphate synthase